MTRPLALGLIVVLGVPSAAQAPPPKVDAPPVLNEIDKLKIVNAAQAVELWNLKVQAAAGELQRAREQLDKLISAAAVPGWQLNDRLEYVKAPKGDKGGQ